MSAPTLDRTVRSPGRLVDVLSDDNRWYVFGDGADAERFLRVSTALDLVGDHDGLLRWATGLSADSAFNELPRIIASTITKDCGNTWKRCQHDYRIRCSDCPCNDCAPCVRKWIANRHYGEASRRAEEGTRVHDVAEHWVLSNGTSVMSHDQDIAVYVKQWMAWVADYGLTPESWEMTEATVINRTHGYAGTLDGIVTVHADASPAAADLVAMVLRLARSQVVGRSVRVIVDAKSREKEEARLFSDMALQQAAYRHAEVVRLRDGREFPLPATDGAVIVQVRPDGYLCRPVASDETTFAAFLHALGYAKWHLASATASVSSRSFKVAPEPKPVKATPAKATPTKRAPAKKAPKKSVSRRPEDMLPIEPDSGRSLLEVAKNQSATLRAIRDWTPPPVKTPHPDSPYGDDIPF